MKMKLFKKKESGQALIMALILLALGSLLVIPLLRQSFTNLGYHQSIECQTLNSYSADAGIVYAKAKIYMNPGTYLETPLDVSFELNGRTVNVIADYHGGGLFSVNSTASGGGCGRTKIVSYINISVGAFSYAVAGKNSISISNAIIDSVPDPGQAHIYSNGDIGITGGSSLVNGDAFAAGSISGQDKITGEIEEGADVLQFPSVYDQLYKNIAQAGGNWTGDLVYSGGTHYVGPLYITGDLIVQPGTMVILEGPLYVVGDISVNHGHLDGQEHILSEGNINITGGGYGSESIPVITSLYGYIDLVGPLVDAVLYAPEGQVRVQNCQLFGAMGGVDCIVSNAIIVYSQALHGRQDLPGSELFPLTYGYE
ncbi:MAG: hypothetical protein E3J40_02135 [Dehalococcoidia bacterium]|nr:MAG: hypothetical protein E3J40_02135 [Dehalococcoidia bacterium]